jgi:hypothetical protein
VLQVLLKRESWTLALLMATDRGEISINELDGTRRELLLKHQDERIRKLAAKLWASRATQARADVLAKYRATRF